MFWDKEKIISVFEKPEAVEGDPYIRKPIKADKAKETIRPDRETGKMITLWEEKMRYPYKTKVASELHVRTNKGEYIFTLKLEENEDGEKSFFWNGQNIPKILWSTLGISKDSPVGLQASKWHDSLLCYKEHYINELTKQGASMKADKYRRLTTLIYRQLLKNNGVGTIKANIMAGAVGAWQFVSPQWWGIADI